MDLLPKPQELHSRAIENTCAFPRRQNGISLDFGNRRRRAHVERKVGPEHQSFRTNHPSKKLRRLCRVTPKPIIDRLNYEINRVLGLQATLDWHAKIGAHPMPMTVSGFTAFLREDIEKQRKWITEAKIQTE
jgi:hypothetical protein